jgi:signal transduction histidine kinase
MRADRLGLRAGAQDGVRAADVALPLVVAAVGTAELVAGRAEYAPLAAALVTFWAACATLVLRRRYPLAMPPLVTLWFGAGAALGVEVGGPASWIVPMTFACFAAGRYAPWPASATGHWPGAASVLLSLAGSYLVLETLTGFSPDLLFGLIGSVVPWLLGRGLRRELDRSARLAVQAERVTMERERDVAAAAAAERERIARELHDVLAHSLSVMVVQSSLAEDLVARDPDAAVDALRAVQDSGRGALAETGRLLRLIRDDADELGLQPGRALGDLGALVGELGRSGLRVTLEADPDLAADVPVGVQLSAYRIVQEALTNALKHAPGSPVGVRLVRDGAAIRLDVRNGPPTAAPVVTTDGGHGLAGIRERVALFGGTLRHDRTPDGGFHLSASLPVGGAP